MHTVLRLLVVDDDAANRDIATVILRASGHEVSSCTNGEEALALVCQDVGRFDALILDIQMPKMDGLEVARRLRARPDTHELPIVCVSARASGSDATAGLAAGCDTYVTKPYRRKELLEALEAALALRRRVG